MAVSADAIQASGEIGLEQPIRLGTSRDRADRTFRASVFGIASIVLVVFGAIGVFLAYQAIPTYHRYGISFLTKAVFVPSLQKIGIAGALVGTFEIALVALAIAFPVSLGTALFISEYAPVRVKGLLIGLVDLMAAVPSVIYGAWGLLLLMPNAKYVSRWLTQNFGWIPLFKVNTDANAAAWAQSRFIGSAFIAGVCVSLMVIPIACSVMRGVFAQAPIGERESAYALGGTRWGMIRAVVLPFGRGGIIGGTMLGLGRALGETVAVTLIISTNYKVNVHILQQGSSSISQMIADNFGEASKGLLTALLAAGLVLFLITLAVNTLAAVVISRSRSGAATEI